MSYIHISLITLLFLFASCRSVRINQNSNIADVSKPVVITPDSSLFRKGGIWPDSPFHFEFFYTELMGLKTGSVTLKQGEDSKLYLSSSTYFESQGEPCPYLVYPGEHIIVKREEDETLSYVVEGNEERNNELMITKILYNKSIEKSYSFNFYGYNTKPADSILQTEALAKGAVQIICYNRLKLIDSLTAVYPVSRKFKTYLVNVSQAHSMYAVESLVYGHKEQYLQHDLYDEKVRKILSGYGDIRNKTTLFVLQDWIDILFGKLMEENKIKWMIRTDSTFLMQYEFACLNFKGLAKDYLISKIMYWSVTHNIQAAIDYHDKFMRDCDDKGFKKIIENEFLLRKKLYTKTVSPTGNYLLETQLKKKKDIKDVLIANKGNLVLVDFWASWCIPCREELVAARELEKKYKEKEIRFMYISLDKDISSWRKASLSENLVSHPNYIWLNTQNSSFIKEFNIATIPRYMLVGKNGSIIDADAPAPSDPELIALIEKYIR